MTTLYNDVILMCLLTVGQESNISRYNVEFMELGVIGSGQFGRVARALNRLDGCVYALKRSLRPVAGSAAERAALNEVYAHAALGKHEHLVRYTRHATHTHTYTHTDEEARHRDVYWDSCTDTTRRGRRTTT